MMEQETTNSLQKNPPFNNLFLLSGLTTGKNNALLYTLGICLVIVAYMLSFNLLAIPFIYNAFNNGISIEEIKINQNIIFNADLLGMNRNIVLAALVSIHICSLIGLIVAIKYIHKKTILSVINGYAKFRKNRFAFGFFVWAGLLLFTVLISYILSPDVFKITFDARNFFVSFLILIILFPFQTLFEELFFRGYLLQGFGLAFKNGLVSAIFSSVLFAAAHLANPEVLHFGWQIMVIYYFMNAFFFASITLLDEGLELSYGIHFANNLLSCLLITQPHSVIKAYSVFSSNVDSADAEVFLSVCMIAVTFAIFWVKYKWKNFKLILK